MTGPNTSAKPQPLSPLRQVRKNYLYAQLRLEGKIHLEYWDFNEDIPPWWTKTHFSQAVDDLLLGGLATIDSATLTMSLASRIPSPQEADFDEDHDLDSFEEA